MAPRATFKLAGHPLHPALAHLPMGAWIAAAVWDGAALATGDPLWWRMAFASLALGLVAAVPAALAGFLDFVAIPDGHRAERPALRHLGVMLAAASAYLGSLLARGGAAPPAGGARTAALLLAAAGLVLLVLGGRLGGELVYRHRLGVAEGGSDPAGEKAD